jgi:hypothetical protein
MIVAETCPALHNSGRKLVLWQKVVPAEVLTQYDRVVHWFMLQI